MEAMLLCLSCPVRLHCVEEALEHKAVGIWAASTTLERHRLRKLPISEAVDVLEVGLAERVRARVEAVRRKHPDVSISEGRTRSDNIGLPTLPGRRTDTRIGVSDLPTPPYA